jgi:hypothetical protein
MAGNLTGAPTSQGSARPLDLNPESRDWLGDTDHASPARVAIRKRKVVNLPVWGVRVMSGS